MFGIDTDHDPITPSGSELLESLGLAWTPGPSATRSATTSSGAVPTVRSRWTGGVEGGLEGSERKGWREVPAPTSSSTISCPAAVSPI